MFIASDNVKWSFIVILSLLHLIRTIATDMLHSMDTKLMATPEAFETIVVLGEYIAADKQSIVDRLLCIQLYDVMNTSM